MKQKYPDITIDTLCAIYKIAKLTGDFPSVYEKIKIKNPVLYNEIHDCTSMESFLSKTKEIFKDITSAGKWKAAKINLTFKKFKQVYASELPVIKEAFEKIKAAVNSSEQIKKKFESEKFNHDIDQMLSAMHMTMLAEKWFRPITTFLMNFDNQIKKKEDFRSYAPDYEALMNKLKQDHNEMGIAGVEFNQSGVLHKLNKNKLFSKKFVTFSEWLKQIENRLAVTIPTCIKMEEGYDALRVKSYYISERVAALDGYDLNDSSSYSFAVDEVSHKLKMGDYFDLLETMPSLLWGELKYMINITNSYTIQAQKLVEIYS